MQFGKSVRRRLGLVASIFAFVALHNACGRGTDPVLGTFHLGEKVQIGPVSYNALEAEWKPALFDGGRAPQNRFLFVTVSATNGGGGSVTLPMFELMGGDGKRYQEVARDMEGVRDWLGMFRVVEPAQTARGVIVFDVPMAAYKLVIPASSDIENEKHALVNIPVQIE